MAKRIILFELNEVPFKILDTYCSWHPKSAFARLLPHCFQYATHTEDVSHLSPWVTWPSLHRGINDERHGIAEFGQNLKEADSDFPPLWQLLARSGIATGVCGSLHSYPMPDDLNNFSFYVPDTFAAGKECFPNKLDLFQDFNLRMARDSARNVSDKLPWGAALRLLAHAPELGFRLTTLAEIAGQLASERVIRWRAVRRRTYQAVLAFDVFLKQLKTTRPAFSTFFSNHVASSLHRYWAASFPEDYSEIPYPDEWIKTYRNEIDFTMSKAESMFADLVQFADRNPGTEVWVATSMGQHATRAGVCETQLYLTDPDRLMKASGLEATDWSRRPSMQPHFNMIVSPAKIAGVRTALASLKIAGEPLKVVEKDNGFFSLFFGQPNLIENAGIVQFQGRSCSMNELGLTNVEIQDKSGTCAYHIPQGCLWIYDPKSSGPKTARPTISTLDIAPAILNNFAVPLPGYMKKAAPIGAA